MNENRNRWMVGIAAVVICFAALAVIRWTSKANSSFKPYAASSGSGMRIDTTAQSIQQIQNDPKIPVAEKARIIRAIQSRAGAGVVSGAPK